MAENQIASTVNLAKSILTGLDPTALNVTLSSATVKLLLGTLIELGMANNPTAQAVRQAQVGFVKSRLTGIEGF